MVNWDPRESRFPLQFLLLGGSALPRCLEQTPNVVFAGTMSAEGMYCFVVEWFDKIATLKRKYQLFYYLGNGMIEMYDPKNRRTFLKKCVYEGVSLKDLFIGSKISIYSRQLTVTEYGDDFTRRSLEQAQAKTCCVLKPAAYDSYGKIIDALLGAGFQITQAKMCALGVQQARAYLGAGADAGEAKSLAMDNVLALELVSKNAVAKLNAACGFTQGQAPDAKLRKALGSLTANAAVRASKTSDDAGRELEVFFGARSSVKSSASFSNCTMCVIKPGAVKAGYTGAILDAILSEGYEISGLEMFKIDFDTAKEFLEVYDTVVPYFSAMTKHMTEGPLVAVEVRTPKEQTVRLFREFTGPVDPVVARHIRPDTLRAKFGSDKVKNGVHCTDLPEDGPLESEFFFNILQKAK